jgi:hypothetical protein
MCSDIANVPWEEKEGRTKYPSLRKLDLKNFLNE